jgi:hypothetical protein
MFIRKTLATVGVALAVAFGSSLVPAVAHADTGTGGLAGSGVTVGSTVGTEDGGEYIDGLNKCKVWYTTSYDGDGCRAVPIPALCGHKVKHVSCTRY